MKDTTAWIFQIYIAAGTAIISSLYGVWALSGVHFQLAIGCLFFGSYIVVTLQKMIRDNQKENKDTFVYRAIPWIALVFCTIFTWYSLKDFPIEKWHLAQIITSFLFTTSSILVLAKTIRDQKEYEDEHQKRA